MARVKSLSGSAFLSSLAEHIVAGGIPYVPSENMFAWRLLWFPGQSGQEGTVLEILSPLVRHELRDHSTVL